MKARLYNQIARKYGMTTLIPFTEVDGTTPQSEKFIDYGLSTTEDTWGGTFSPSFNTVGNGDWADTSAATTSSLVTATNVVLPGAAKGFLIAFAMKSASHPNYTDGEFSIGNPASGSLIQYASVSETEGTVTIKDLLAATQATITTTEIAAAGSKAVVIHCGDRATGNITVWSGRASGVTASTGTGTLTNPAANIITSNYYMQDIDELHPILGWEYTSNVPTPTDAEVSNFIGKFYNESRFGLQKRDWDAIPDTWTNTTIRDNLL